MIRAEQPGERPATTDRKISTPIFSSTRLQRGTPSSLAQPLNPARWRNGSQRLIARLVLVVAMLATVSVAIRAHAQSSVTLGWNAVAGTDIAGYNLYYGRASRSYTTRVQAGNATSATASALTAGATYYFAVTAYDTSGLESDYSSEITYTVPVGAPTVTLTSPGNGAVYMAPGTVNLAASVSANGHTITKVQFYNGATLLGQDTTAPYTYTWSNVGAGSYSLSAKVTYDSGSTASSAATSVNISGASGSSILTFAATSGTLSLPFTILNSSVVQTLLTDLLGGGTATYSFNVPQAGYYCVSALVSAPNSGENSFYVNIDAQPTDPLMIWDIPRTSGFANQIVSWRGNGNGNSANDQYKQKAFNLSAGTHQLIVRGKAANVALKTLYIYAAPPTLQTAIDGNGLVTLTATGQPGQTYDVMASQNFSTWTVIGVVTLDASGSAQFSDPAKASMASRSYRLRQH